MIAKLRACQAARDAGVTDVRIVDGRDPAFSSGTRLMGGAAGTRPAAGN
jgi:acetylglutamate kinase